MTHNIITGADNDDYNEVNAALDEDPNAIRYQDAETGMTAVHVAAGDGNLKMVNHLLAVPGVDIAITDKFNRDPLEMAIAVGHKGIIEELSRQMYPKSFSDSGTGPASVVSIFPPKPR